MEVDQITSLVSIFSFGQQLLSQAKANREDAKAAADAAKQRQDGEEDSEDSDSDTSSDSGHSSDDHPEDVNNPLSSKTASSSTSSESAVNNSSKFETTAEVSGVGSVPSDEMATDLTTCSSTVRREAERELEAGSREVAAAV